MAKFCSHCGAPLKPESKFCPKCGNAIGTSPKAGSNIADHPRSGSKSSAAILIVIIAVCVAALVFVIVKFTLPRLHDSSSSNTPAPSTVPFETVAPSAMPSEAPAEALPPKAEASEPASEASSTTWQASYDALLDRFINEYPSYRYTCSYCLYDIDEEGTPEIFVKLGTCEADFEYRVYTFSADSKLTALPTLLGTFGGGHTSICGISESGCFLIWGGHMNFEFISKCRLDDEGFSDEVIFSGECTSYHDLTSLPIYELDDRSALDWTGNPYENNSYVLENYSPEPPVQSLNPLAQFVASSPDPYYARLHIDSWQADSYKGPFVVGSTLYESGFGIFGNKNDVFEWEFSLPAGASKISFELGPDAYWQYGSYDDYGSSRIEFVAADGTVLYDSGTFSCFDYHDSWPLGVEFDTLGYSTVYLRFTVMRGTEGTMNVVFGNASVLY